MITFIILIIVILICSIYFSEDIFDFIEIFTTSSVIVGLIFLVISTILSNTNSVITAKEYSNKYQIYSIVNSSQQESKIKGLFILGCGYINGGSSNKHYYIFYKETKYGLQECNLEVKDNVFIKQDAVNPYIEYKIVKEDAILNKSKFYFSIDLGDYPISSIKSIIIHLPPNSIIKTIDVNLNNLQ